MAPKRRSRVMEPGGHRRLRGLGAAVAALLAGIHLGGLGHAAGEATYLGMLFSVAAAGFGWVAADLLRSDDIDGWVVGAALAVGATVAYVLSCTVGLPGLSREHWSVLGNTSTLLAAALLAAAGARTRLHSERNMP